MSRWTWSCLLLAVAATACRPTPPPIAIPSPDTSRVQGEIAEVVAAARVRVEAAPDSAEAWGAYGDRLAAHDWLDEAASALGRAADLAPDDFRWPYRRGISLSRGGRHEEALASFEEALALRDDHAPLFLAIAQSSLRLGRDDEAEAAFRRAVELDPSNSHAWLGLGQLLSWSGDPLRAREALETALARAPQHREAHHALAELLAAEGELEEARRHAAITASLPKTTPPSDALAAPRLEPAGSEARFREAQLLQLAGREDEALQQLETSLRLDPRNDAAHHVMSRLLLGRGRSAEAESHAREAVRWKSTRAEWRWSLAAILLQGGRVDEAIVELRETLALEPDHPQAHYALGLALTATAPREAVEELEAHVELQPGGLQARVHLARLLESLGEIDRARAQLVAAVERQPGASSPLLLLAEFEFRNEQWTAALAGYSGAQELDPSSGIAVQGLAWLLATHPDAANRDGKKALAYARLLAGGPDANSAVVLDTLAAGLAESGRWDEAAETAARAESAAAAAGAGELAEAIGTRRRGYLEKRAHRLSSQR